MDVEATQTAAFTPYPEPLSPADMFPCLRRGSHGADIDFEASQTTVPPQARSLPTTTPPGHCSSAGDVRMTHGHCSVEEERPALRRASLGSFASAAFCLASLLPAISRNKRRSTISAFAVGTAIAVIFSPRPSTAQKVNPASEYGSWGRDKNSSRVRKNWVTHVSASFNERRYTMIA